ncbi:MAG: hypothetical protein K0Q73_5620 [Paenibacillus sp.]|jgi:predicted MFS family arabinose efflux permease|nr:hypothetical protein [Paenibacillus sp.]
MKEGTRLYFQNILSRLHFIRRPSFWIGMIISLLVASGGVALIIYLLVYLMLRYE